jgi:polyisoprenoid-binding protein YceI
MKWAYVLGSICLSAVTFSSTGFAALQTTAGSATFVAEGPAGLRIEGKTSDVRVSESQGQVHVSVGLANLDTGIALRNRHMREKYLEVQKYPSADLLVSRAALSLPQDGADVSGTANGTMMIHGQSKPVSFTYRARRDHQAYDVTGNVHINVKDYGISVPSYLGITVKPDVEVAVRYVANDT